MWWRRRAYGLIGARQSTSVSKNESGPLEREALGAELEDQERRVAGGLHVEGDELRVVERRQRADLGSVDRDLLPRHGRGGAARLEVERL